MSRAAFVTALFLVVGCGAEPAPNPFPPAAQAAFAAECRGGEAFCACSWDQITRQFTAEDWETARTSLEATGHPDPRIVVISNQCREETR